MESDLPNVARLYHRDNTRVLPELLCYAVTFDLIYCDFIYDDTNFWWLDYCYALLKPTGSLYIQTDYRSAQVVPV